MTTTPIPGDLLIAHRRHFTHHLVFEVRAIEDTHARVRRLGLSSGTDRVLLGTLQPWPLTSPYRWRWWHAEPNHVGVWLLHRDGQPVAERFLRVKYIPPPMEGSHEPVLLSPADLTRGEQKAADYLVDGLTRNWNYFQAVAARRARLGAQP